MAKTNGLTILNVERNRLLLCHGKSDSPLVLEIPPKIMNDLEVVDHTGLSQAIKDFVAKNQIPPSALVLILSSDICFEKDLEGVLESELPSVTQKFIDTVPLASISAKTFTFQNKKRLIVINRRFYEVLNTTFTELRFSVVAVVPGFALGELGLKSPLTGDSCRLLLRKVGYLKDNSFISGSQPQNFSSKKQHFYQKNQILLVIFFLIALSFLGFTAYMTLRKPKPAPVVAPLPRAVVTVTPEPTPVATPAAVLTSYTVQILNGSGVEGAATSLQEQLQALGLTQFTVGNTNTVSATSLVIFKPLVPNTGRQQIIDVLRETYPQISSQENPGGQFDISITIGQSTALNP